MKGLKQKGTCTCNYIGLALKGQKQLADLNTMRYIPSSLCFVTAEREN